MSEDEASEDMIIQNEKVRLTRGMTGKYGWQIDVVNKEGHKKMLEKLDEINKMLIDKYDYGIN